MLKNIIRRCSTLPSIYSLASGNGQPCGIAVVRISGTQCLDVIQKMTNLNQSAQIVPAKVYYSNIYHPLTKIKIDKGIVIWFKGEDVCEIHLHGGLAIISLLYNALSTFRGLRLAEPGEFSKRAFLNARMDLTEVEGLADLISAETEMQRRQALDQMQGSLKTFYNDCKDKIIRCLANIEAYIDFNEEENIEDDVLIEGERLRNGIRIVIVGEPNSGKSSLLNCLSQRPLAIVSSIPGTTRDVIESAVNIGGYPVLLSDTAGLRQSNDIIEQEGIKRAKERTKLPAFIKNVSILRLNESDVIILLIDSQKYIEKLKSNKNDLTYKFIEEHFAHILSPISVEYMSDILNTKQILVAFNKIDLLQVYSQMTSIQNINNSEKDNKRNIKISTISCLNEDGIKNLLEKLKSQLNSLCSFDKNVETPIITQQRHRDNLVKCVECIDSYLSKIDTNDVDYNIVMNAEKLRNAAKYLSKITGQITNEHILDAIFKEFCIGK